MDADNIGTGLSILGASQVTKDSVARMLAPTADYIGAGVLSGAKATTNLARIFLKAATRLGSRVDSGGQLPPRVLRAALDDGPFCDDELVAEYFGGVLASSWGDIERDDRGVALLATLSRLSTYAIRTHYLLYRAYDNLYRRERNPPLNHQDDALFLPFASYEEGMSFAEGEDRSAVLSHSIISLERENLASLPWAGTASYFRSTKDDDFDVAGLSSLGLERLRSSGGIIFSPRIAGVELFLWAHGVNQTLYTSDLLRSEVDELFTNSDIPAPVGTEVVPDTVIFPHPR